MIIILSIIQLQYVSIITNSSSACLVSRWNVINYGDSLDFIEAIKYSLYKITVIIMIITFYYNIKYRPNVTRFLMLATGSNEKVLVIKRILKKST
jgi:hypothetical protein